MTDKKLSWYEKLVAKLAAIRATDPHKEKPEYEGLEWKPGEKADDIMDLGGGNSCIRPDRVKWNAADRVNRARQQRDNPPQEDNSDPWAAANDPALAHYDTPGPPPAIGGPDDPAYVRHQLLDRLRRR